MTVLGISSKCDISLNMIYHKIHELEKLHLLHVSGDIDTVSKRQFYYQSKIKSYNLKFIDGKTNLEIIYN
jgi:hypothetical protein